MNKKITHNEVCDECGKVATVNISNSWHRFDINEKGKYVNEEVWEGEPGGTFCDECADDFLN